MFCFMQHQGLLSRVFLPLKSRFLIINYLPLETASCVSHNELCFKGEAFRCS
jgi:hypothetical protein